MKQLITILSLTLILNSPVAAETLAPAPFAESWQLFLSEKEIDRNSLGKEEHLKKEFALIEEFGVRQFHRRRPGIKGMDRDERWVPFQDNKVTLSDGIEMSASHVRFAKAGYHNFIASQAPYKHNIHLFWQMIWENQTNQIVQVTELAEPTGELSVPYWPEKIGETVTLETGLKITFAEERWLLPEIHEKIQIRTFHLFHKGERRVVTHYWYRNWPDRTAPGQSRTIATLIETVHQEKLQSGSQAPIAVHCHGGVGRTGVFITLYHWTQRNQFGETPVPFFDFVASLRWQRPKLLSNPAQYAFCYRYLGF